MMISTLSPSVGILNKLGKGWLTLSLVVLGSAFLATMARIAVPLPFTTVPATMQTFAVFVLAGTLGSKRAALSVMAYLVEGTCGLPVFGGGTLNPLWFIGGNAGYLIGFLCAAYLGGKLLEIKTQRSFAYLLGVLGVCEALILLLGMCWLAQGIGFANAFSSGVVPFILEDLIKVFAAASLLHGMALTGLKENLNNNQ